LVAVAQSSRLAYSVLDLGPVGGAPGAPYFTANNGLVAGAAGTPENQSHAEVWFLGLRLDVATPGLGGLNSFSYSMNEKGQVVGGAETTVANGEDFCGFNAYGAAKSFTTCLPFAWQNGVMTKLPTLGGPNGVATMGARWWDTSRPPHAIRTMPVGSFNSSRCCGERRA
jgi:uncharacterized membrane protein